MINSLQNFTVSLPPLFQWFGVFVAGAIPFIESHFGAVIGIVAGVSPPVAIFAAILGNIVSMLVFVLGADTIRSKLTGRQNIKRSPRLERLRQAFDKFGVAGVSLLSPAILSNQFTSAALISFGIARKTVLFWQLISIVLWGMASGLLAAFGVNLLSRG